MLALLRLMAVSYLDTCCPIAVTPNEVRDQSGCYLTTNVYGLVQAVHKADAATDLECDEYL